MDDVWGKLRIRNLFYNFLMKKNKPFIIAGLIIIGIGLLIWVAAIVIGNKIENELQNQQVGSYIIQNRNVKVNLFMRQITIRNTEIEDTVSGNFISIPETIARGIHIFPLIFRDNLIINKVIIGTPQITLLKNSSEEKEEITDRNPDIEQETDIEHIGIRKLEIQNASLLLQEMSENKSDTLFFLQTGLELWNLNIGSREEQLRFEEHSAERFRISAQSGSYHIPGDLYLLNFESFTFDTRQEALNLENLHLSSIPAKYEIGKLTGVETDWYDITLQQFEVQGISLDAFLNDTALVFRKATLQELNAHIFRDKRPPFPEKPDTPLPMKMLENLPVAFHSDSILITSSKVVYEEHGEESNEPGMVTFNGLYASIYNLSTLHDSIRGQTAMSARATVMNEALLEAEFVFPNSKHSFRYNVAGKLAPVNLAAFNTMVVPSAFVKINDGQLKGLNFDYSYNTENSEGWLTMEYENLDISLLNKEDGSTKKFKTFITETFVLNKDNLKEDNSYQEGKISFERDKKKSIFNYWWKSLFSGIKDILAF